MLTGQELDFILEQLSEEVILEFFEAHGATEYSRTERHVWFDTFCHGGDSHKLCYNRESKSFYCYTHCGYLSVFTLAQQVLHVSFYEAVQRLAELVGADRRHRINTLDWVDRSYIQDLEQRAQANNIVVPSVPFDFPELNETILKYFDNRTFYRGWINEGISIETMQEFEISWDELTLSIIIPHRDINNKLAGIRKRVIHAATNKYVPVYLNGRGYAHPLAMNLYGIHRNQETIRRTHRAVIFEGEKSVLKHASLYDRSNAVAVCGSHISEMQRALLLHLGVEEVTIAFDRDYELQTSQGKLYKEKLLAVARTLTPFMRTYVILDRGGKTKLKDSPIDGGKEVFEELMRKRELVSTTAGRRDPYCMR